MESCNASSARAILVKSFDLVTISKSWHTRLSSSSSSYVVYVDKLILIVFTANDSSSNIYNNVGSWSLECELHAEPVPTIILFFSNVCKAVSPFTFLNVILKI